MISNNQQYTTVSYSKSKIKAVGNNGNSKSPYLQDIIANNELAIDNHYKARLEDIEKRNADLKKLVALNSREMSQIIATNSKYISIIAHDLRSPFNSILGVLEILKESIQEDDMDKVESYLNIASDSAKSTLKLLENLLEWAVIQNKGKSFNPVKINLAKLLKNDFDIFYISAKEKQITFNNYIAPDIKVYADLQMVKTIFRNLISNAIKFSNTGGEISINASENDPFIEILITDKGIGISQTEQQELFKVDSIQTILKKNKEKSKGLGLLLCKEFVEIHEGNITVESEPGQGSSIKFTLPLFK